jgi:signal transduction histidine kinase
LRLGQQAVARAAMLTHRLLAFSSRQSLQSQAIDLRALLTPDALAAKLGAGIELQVRLATQLWVANADGEQLQASLDNLLRNACEAMPSGGVLSVEADNVQVASDPPANAGLARGDYLCLSIRDSGQGMSQATLEHAIEPFFTTKPTGQGVGLGLSMVYGFSRQSRGYLTLDSQIGKGTRVRLYLPRHTDSQPQLGTAPPRRPVIARTSCWWRTTRMCASWSSGPWRKKATPVVLRKMPVRPCVGCIRHSRSA